VLFVFSMSRMIAAGALTTGVPAAADRGAFMAINSSLQQLSGGLASVIAGAVVAQSASGRLERYNLLGCVVAAIMAVTILLMFNVHRVVQRRDSDSA
jgi:predicted MFS family arabinose efflux permease